jgi:hypothetical protein
VNLSISYGEPIRSLKGDIFIHISTPAVIPQVHLYQPNGELIRNLKDDIFIHMTILQEENKYVGENRTLVEEDNLR